MATVLKPDPKSMLADKKALLKIVERLNEEMGVTYDPTATAERAQAMTAECLRAHGLTPEDNIASRSIIAARDEE